MGYDVPVLCEYYYAGAVFKSFFASDQVDGAFFVECYLSGSLEPVMHDVLEEWHDTTEKCWKAVPHAIGYEFIIQTEIVCVIFLSFSVYIQTSPAVAYHRLQSL